MVFESCVLSLRCILALFSFLEVNSVKKGEKTRKVGLSFTSYNRKWFFWCGDSSQNNIYVHLYLVFLLCPLFHLWTHIYGSLFLLYIKLFTKIVYFIQQCGSSTNIGSVMLKNRKIKTSWKHVKWILLLFSKKFFNIFSSLDETSWMY